MEQNFQQYFRSLQVLFFALLASQILICTILWFLPPDNTAELDFQEDMWWQMIAGFSFSWVFAGMFFRKKLIEKAKAHTELMDKFNQYRAAQILGWASLEGITLLNAIFFFLSGKMEFFYVAAVVIAVFVTRIPAKYKLVNELDLDASTESMLDDPNTMVANLPRGKN